MKSLEYLSYNEDYINQELAEYADEIMHTFRKSSTPLTGKTEHCFPARVQLLI
ncbi:hypothetical protein OXPF_06210 [Oxobacter pfennigii]|uniref:Uncharacterized protein n=1 Tax=Oxobacter pfennigii TaxID=36849 RepID=A0A0P8WBU1_9CLOT|nr:hypothetical protein [Oxobacter pfennigii]KPU45388.1 hypothetical protein OXPF_06210 [Oxobacter pfennigii]